MSRTAFGSKAEGASNLDELQDLLRATFMIRRLKADVLTELPAKRRQVIELPANGASAEIAAEVRLVAETEERLTALRAAVELAKVSDDPRDYRDAVAALREGETAAFTEMSKARLRTAIAKAPYVIDHVREACEEGGKVVLFAHHKEVVRLLTAGLADLRPVVITGDTALSDRQLAVDAFQQDPSVKVFIGNMQAAGVGITLTAAAHVVFAELDWVPGNLSQCEDRCHRIGQQDSVLVQHLVLEGSIDARMAQVVVEKQAVLDKALDADPSGRRAEREAEEAARMEAAAAGADAAAQARQRAPEERERPVRFGERAATADSRREDLLAEGSAMTPEQVAAVHAGLRLVAGMDQDRASALNGIGFNRLDGTIGHSLAERERLTPKQAALGRRLLRKYRRQVPAAVLEAAGIQAAS